MRPMKYFIGCVLISHFYIVLADKPSQVFACTMKVDKEFQPGYKDINSPESRALKNDLNKVLKPFFTKKFPQSFQDIKYKRFFDGSVGIDFDLLFRSISNVSNNNIVQALEEGNGTRDLAFMRITGDISVTKKLSTDQQTTTPSESSTTASPGNKVYLATVYVGVSLPALETEFKDKLNMFSKTGD